MWSWPLSIFRIDDENGTGSSRVCHNNIIPCGRKWRKRTKLGKSIWPALFYLMLKLITTQLFWCTEKKKNRLNLAWVKCLFLFAYFSLVFKYELNMESRCFMIKLYFCRDVCEWFGMFLSTVGSNFGGFTFFALKRHWKWVVI